ncbi:MAG: flagellar filament capping protein FliD [Mycobacteriales bacterium]
MSGSVISGLGSGIDLQSIVTQLMNAERSPETQMNTLRLASLAAQSAWADIGSKLSSLQTAAQALDTTSAAQGSAATSSDTSTLTATAGPGAVSGSTAVTVVRLATAQQLTTGALSAPSMLVGAGQAVVSAGLSTLGASGLQVTGATADGAHTLTVIQASQAATAAGSSGPATSYSAGSNDLTVTLADGIAHTVTLGTYADSAALVTDLNTQLAGVAQVNLVAGQLQVSSRDQGSAATLTLAGGALAGLGLAAGTTSGTDAQVSLDGAAPTTVTHVDSGTTVSLGNGVSFSTGTHLEAGTASFTVARTTATSTLADLAAALNVASSPVSAALINTGDGSATPYRMVLTAKGTGTAGALTLDTSGINVLDPGQLSTVTAASDAQLSVGGATITRSSNTITDLLPGVTVNLVHAGSSTVTVASDPTGTTTRVQSLVDAVNNVLSSVATQTAYSATTNKGGPLSGEGMAQNISDTLLDQVLAAAGTGQTKILSQLGIETTRDGKLSFNSAQLASSLQSDPDGVASLLSTFAKSVEDYAKQATSSTGVVTTSQAAAGDAAKQRQDQIDAFEVRMSALQTAYQAKFAALDAALGSLKQQQSAVNSAIGSLPPAG